MRHALYMSTIILFCGPMLLVLWVRGRRVLRAYGPVLYIMAALSVVMAFADYFATRWGAWTYNPASTLGIHAPGEAESYLFAAIVTIIIASATLILAKKVDAESGANRDESLS